MSSTTPKLLTLLAIALLCSISFARDWQEGTADPEDLKTTHKCTHDEFEKEDPLFLDVDEDTTSDHTGRTLADYPNLKMYGYYDLLKTSAPSSYASYVQEDLIPPILDYFSAALKNKYPLQSNMVIRQSTLCYKTTPSVLKNNGLDTDFFYMTTAVNSYSLGYVAQSQICYIATDSKRPIVALTKLNRYYLKETNDVLLHEKNMVCIMHEVIHTLGFSNGLYQYFSSGTIVSGTLDGATSKILVAEPLNTKLRQHFGCTNLRGAYMENSGSSGTAGSHFERRQFANEIMTSGLIYDMQMSPFSLALLESTGWYLPDYSYADNYNWGRGQGCNFLTQSCSSSSFRFDEFCTGSSRGCTFSGATGGTCNSDARSDNCRFVHPSIEYHCENPGAASYTKLPGIQTFGRGANSKCFTGTLATTSTSTQSSYCFKYSCSGSNSSTQLTLILGSTQVKCLQEGQVTVNGYRGYINCPDPLTFCSTVGKQSCPRGCMGRGTCINGTCSCKSGYKGKDCALNA